MNREYSINLRKKRAAEFSFDEKIPEHKAAKFNLNASDGGGKKLGGGVSLQPHFFLFSLNSFPSALLILSPQP